MKRFRTKAAAWTLLGLIAALGGYAYSQTLCAVVQLQILQQATLEREAFQAQLGISNNLTTTPLTNLKVQIFFKDSNGNAADSMFFVAIATLTNVNAVDGTGVVQSSSTANINWLIIPSTGAGGTNPAGQQYAVSALITGLSNGVAQTVTTFNAFITVQPQPAINLQYVLPYEVFAQEPLTPNIIGPVVPFPLGVRVTNVGYGPANNFQINSAQPTIVDNKQGLALDVALLGTVVSSQTIPNTLLLPFGNVQPNGVALGQWIMATSLSGRFISFTSTFTHAADLGGQLTSLIQGVTTYTLLHAVLVDLPGRDQTPDFLVNESMNRTAMQAVLDSGLQPPAEAILESDQPLPLPVAEIPGAISGTLSGTSGALTYRFTQGVSSNVWVHSYVPFSYGNNVALSYVTRGDGKVLNSHNAWVSEHFDISTLTDIYWLNILDLTTTTNTYTVQFSSVGLNIPPAAVANLNAVTLSSGGSVNLSWTAPGDGGNTGNILGGRYLIETTFSSTTPLSPSFAQVDIVTATSPGNLENLIVTGLVGNATFNAYLWTQNTGGVISPISNGATVYTLPNPPSNLAFTTVGSTYTVANWLIGNNNLPILYQVTAATASGGVAISSSPLDDSFTSTNVFTGLTPNTTYFFSGVGVSSAAGSSSPAAALGSLLTAAAPPIAVQVVATGTGAVTAVWSPGLDPPGTQYLVELSSAPDLFPPTYSSGWLTSSSFTFTGVAPQYLYSARVLARNSALVPSSYTELGTAAFNSAINPAAGAGGSQFSIVGANFGVYAGTTSTRVQFGAGGPLATITSWNDYKISGFVPALSTGAYAVLIERQTGASIATIAAGTFTVGTVSASSGPVVTLSPFDEDEVTTSTPAIVASYTDSTAAISTASVRLALDGVDVTTQSLVTSNAVSFVPTAILSEGTHTVTASVADAAAYLSSASATFLVDTIPPDTSLTVDGQIAASTAPVVTSTDTLGFSAFDAGSGAVDTVFLVDLTYNSCDFTNFVSTAPPGTCANPYYSSPFTLSAGTHTLSFYSDDDAGNSEDLNIVSVFVKPAASPLVLTLSPSAGSFVAESYPALAVLYTDPSAAIDTTTVRLSLDGVDVTTQSIVAASSASFVPVAAVADGTHTVAASASDFSGNYSSASAVFLVDTIPPVTTLAVDGTTVAAGSFNITSTDTLSLSATDAGSGVADIIYVVDTDPLSPACMSVPITTGAPNGTCANEAYDGAFTLTAGTHTVYYFSEDLAGNQEEENISSFTVTVPSAPTLASLAVAPSSATLAAGASIQFLAVGTFTDGSTQAVTASWSSDTPAVATVTPSGLATALSAGTANVTASSGALSGSAAVTVIAASSATYLSVTSISPSSATTGATFGANVTGTGFDPTASLSLEHFRVGGGTWTTGSPLSTARQDPATVLLHDGRVLTAGGFNASGTALSSVELYNPVAGTWSPAAPLPVAVYSGILVVLNNGQALYAGGQTGSTSGPDTALAELYDPVANTWTATGPLLTAVNQAMSALLPDGRVLLAGGYTPGSGQTAAVQIYDPVAGTWSAGPAMSGPRDIAGVTVLSNGRVLVAGGSTGGGQSAAVQLFDGPTNSWIAAASMLTARYGQGQALLPDGRVIAVGGDQVGISLNSSEIYDPVANTWTAGPNLSVGRGLTQQTIAVDGRVVAIGGDVAGGFNGTVEVYEPSLNAWKLAAPLPAPVFNSTALQLNDGRVILPGGSGGSDASLVTEALTQLLTMPVSTVTATGVSVANAQSLSGTLNLSGAATGYWDVVVNESGNRVARLSSGFDVANAGDVTPPVTTISFSTPSFVSSGIVVAISTRSPVALSAVDLSSGSIPASGVAATYYTVDVATTPVAYSTPFTLSSGTHTVYYHSVDVAGNVEAASSATVAVYSGPFAGSVIPSSGPIGITVSLAGFNFGAYSGANSQLLFGASTSPISVWNDAAITATVPALSSGAYTVSVVSLQSGATAAVAVGSFTVLTPTILTVVPSSAPIGMAFTLTGSAFGAYSGANTLVLIGGATVPISVWSDATITGTVPGVRASPGSYAVQVERKASGGGTVFSNSVSFSVLGLNLAAVSPSTGPIGISYSLTGSGFGTYNAGNTQVLIGGTSTSISVWNDTNITGTVPALSTGAYPLVVERIQGSGLAFSSVATFTVTALSFTGPSPSSGPIGVSFSLSGSGFGPSNGATTRLLFAGTTVALSAWNDTTITGVVPAVSTGSQPVWIERESGNGVESSATNYFTVVAPAVASVAPSSGPIGITYTVSGTGFGTYNGANTLLLIGGTTTSISVWNNTQIQGVVPALSTGSYPVTVEQISGSGMDVITVATFTVTALSFTGPSPSSGPVGTSITFTGPGFGASNGANTRALFAGTTMTLTVWNDATITATIPTSAPGPQPVWLERQSGNGVESSATNYFTVVAPAVASVLPSSGPIGISVTLSGSGFGASNGANTQVLIGGATAPISVWNNTTITATVPGVLASSTGSVSVVVERIASGGISFSTAAAFLVVAPNVATLTPSTGPIGIAFALTGSGFGTYNSANTLVLIGGATAPISAWNSTNISGTVPALASGTYTLQVEILQGGYASLSNPSSFTVAASQIASMTPSSAPIGAPFTISGVSFGAYNGANTTVKFNGIVAPISVWNDTTITGSVPGAVSSGPATVVVTRLVGSAGASVTAPAFNVLVPTISTIAPSYGPAGTAVTLSGFGFGPYAGASGTQLLVNGSTMSVAVWNDSTIRWTVPSSLANGTYPVVVSRTPSGGSVQSKPASFTVGTSMGTSALFASTPAPLAAEPSINFVGDMVLPAAQGGFILTPSFAAVSIPAGALSADTEVTLARDKTSDASSRAAGLGAASLAPAGEPITFGPEGTQFSAPVTIILPYDPTLVPTGALTSLAVQYYDPVAKSWTALTSQVDAVNHVVSAQTSHFSLYQPLIPGSYVALASIDAFSLRTAYVFPNPVRGTRQATIRIEPGLADSVAVDVYDLTGRRVLSTSDFTFKPGAIDPTLGPQDIYDHVWDISGVGSGVYTYVITAKKAGQADIHATGKIGVVK